MTGVNNIIMLKEASMVDKKLIEEVVEDMKNYNKPPTFETGFLDLDDLLRIRNKSALITIGARPAMGKTSFMLNILENQMKLNKKCIFFTLEMNKKQIIQRLLCSNSEIDSWKIRTGNMQDKDWEKIGKSTLEIEKWDLLVNDKSCITIEEIEEYIKEINPDIVFIDYLQLINPTKKKDRNAEINDIMQNLKRIADENNIIIFISSQLSRSLEQRFDKRPMLSDLRDSGSIEYISDIVFFIYREDYYNSSNEEDISKRGTAEIIVAKNKFGPSGTVNLLFNIRIAKFLNPIKVNWEF